jgi:hypothetical protein
MYGAWGLHYKKHIPSSSVFEMLRHEKQGLSSFLSLFLFANTSIITFELVTDCCETQHIARSPDTALFQIPIYNCSSISSRKYLTWK